MSAKKRGTISCDCGKCEITVADGRAIQYFRCGCEDCRQAAQWAKLKGGKAPDQLLHAYYIPADIITSKGKQFMKNVKLRNDGRSSRIYCIECYSLIGVDNPRYQSNVLLISPKHCKTDCDLSVPLTLMLHMIDYPKTSDPPPADDVPLFHSFRYSQELDRFLSIPTVANTFRERSEPLEGISFTSLIKSLGAQEILNLEQGENLLD